jgi:hypothetical protein
MTCCAIIDVLSPFDIFCSLGRWIEQTVQMDKIIISTSGKYYNYVYMICFEVCKKYNKSLSTDFSEYCSITTLSTKDILLQTDFDIIIMAKSNVFVMPFFVDTAV